MNNRWRIGIVAGILLVIAGIWFVKNTDSEEPVAEQEPASTEAAVVTEKQAVPDTEPVDVSMLRKMRRKQRRANGSGCTRSMRIFLTVDHTRF